MGFNRFSIMLAFRLTIILVLLGLLGFLLGSPGYYAATLLTLMFVLILGWEVVRFVSKTNQEITRFLDAARYADFGQRFALGKMGAGFGELGDTFTDILERFRENRTQQESELRYLKALLEHVPVPLISIRTDSSLTLWNNAARRLFGAVQVTRLIDLEQFGEAFLQQMDSVQAGERRLVSLVLDNMERRMTIAVSQVLVAGRSERLISLQDIQSELDGIQLEAWQDLVRVLTHEIMNSITPVASLAKTAVDLVDDLIDKLPDESQLNMELGDVKEAVGTVAHRSDALMHFVSGYRRLTRLPPPEKSRFKLQELFAEVVKLAKADWVATDDALQFRVQPVGLDLVADRDMIEQILINILQNSEQALADTQDPRISLTARLNKRGHVTIDIDDNGPGIKPEIANRIFVPFFTTKRDGSGVGLALTRQVMIAHGGSVSASVSPLGGARFTLIF
jgi:two-component system nitrogen regulation sensor histidine kinase NtrY